MKAGCARKCSTCDAACVPYSIYCKQCEPAIPRPVEEGWRFYEKLALAFVVAVCVSALWWVAVRTPSESRPRYERQSEERNDGAYQKGYSLGRSHRAAGNAFPTKQGLDAIGHGHYPNDLGSRIAIRNGFEAGYNSGK
jgi:hypothetical protein